MPNIWQPVGRVPTRREEEERKAERKAIAESPRPVDGKPGFTIDAQGRMSYNPGRDKNHPLYNKIY